MASMLDLYVKEARKHPPLTKAAELELARRYRAGAVLGKKGEVLRPTPAGARAGRQLVETHLRFALAEAHAYQGRGVTLEDLVQEANLGLLHALPGFDPARGFRFLTYARWWVKAYLGEYVAKNLSVVQIGRGRFCRKTAERKTQQAANPTADLGYLFPDDAELPRLATNDEPIDEMCSDKACRLLVREALGRHTRTMRDRYIVERRILTDEPETLAEIGERFNVSRERVRQNEVELRKRVTEDLAVLAEGA